MSNTEPATTAMHGLNPKPSCKPSTEQGELYIIDWEWFYTMVV